MGAVQQPLGREHGDIAPDGGLGSSQFGGERGQRHLTILLKQRQHREHSIGALVGMRTRSVHVDSFVHFLTKLMIVFEGQCTRNRVGSL
jgi:hypothetical protein